METTELVKALSNINDSWLQYQYINMVREEIAGWTVFVAFVIGIRAAWNVIKPHL